MRYTVRRVAEITEKSRVLTKIGSTQAQYIVRSSASLTFAVNNRQKNIFNRIIGNYTN